MRSDLLFVCQMLFTHHSRCPCPTSTETLCVREERQEITGSPNEKKARSADKGKQLWKEGDGSAFLQKRDLLVPLCGGRVARSCLSSRLTRQLGAHCSLSPAAQPRLHSPLDCHLSLHSASQGNRLVVLRKAARIPVAVIRRPAKSPSDCVL